VFKLLEFIKQHKILLSVVFIYFTFRLFNLTLLPIFNDEAIYLDWGWRETHNPGLLYYSLYDAKQPLLMWIFGVLQNYISDPLIAGRIVSVFTGFLTMSGIYYFCKENISRKTAILASILYIFIPIFSFYDRQALMESSVAACGIWSLVFLSKFLNEKKLLFATLLGFTLGIGFFIKSSSLVFMASSVLIIGIYFLKNREKAILAEGLAAVFVSFFCTVFLLIINPQFWQTLPKNYVFSLSPIELLGFPILKWLSNLWGDLQISFFHLTPFIFVSADLGLIKIAYDKNKKLFVSLLFLIFSFGINVLLARIISDRYLVFLLPLVCIPAGYLIHYSFSKSRLLGTAVFIILLLPALIFTLVQITNPVMYIQGMSNFGKYSPTTYLNGFTSGYGVDKTMSFIRNRENGKQFLVTTAENTGNPESAIAIYFNYMKTPNAKSTYFDARLIGSALNDYQCLTYKNDFYFVSRENQLAGMGRFLQKLTTIKNPYGTNTIGIYTLKKNCKGKTFDLVLSKPAT